MPHPVELDLPDLPADLGFGQAQPRLPDPAVDQRAVAPEYLPEHVVGALGERVEDHAHGLRRYDLLVRARVALDKVAPATLAQVTLFPADFPAFHPLLRTASLATWHDDNLLGYVCWRSLSHIYIYKSTLSVIV